MNDVHNIGNGNGGGERIVLALEYDSRTHQITVGGTPMPLSLAQKQAAADQAIANRVFGGKRIS